MLRLMSVMYHVWSNWDLFRTCFEIFKLSQKMIKCYSISYFVLVFRLSYVNVCFAFPFFYRALYNNSITGIIPPELGNLVNLERLDLSFNNLTGPIPYMLGNLLKLRNLYEFILSYILLRFLLNLSDLLQ